MTTLREARARIHDGEPVFLVSSSAPLRCLPFWLEKLNAARFGPYDPARAAADTDPRPSAGRLSAYVTHCVVDLEWMGAPRGLRLAGEEPPSALPRRRKWARATVQAGVRPCRDLSLGHVEEQGWRLRWRGTAVAGFEWKDATHLAH